MDIHTIVLKKPKRAYVLRYKEGFEAQAVEEVMRWADAPSFEVDWQDAANISCRILSSVSASIPRIGETGKTAVLKGGSQA